MSDAYEDNYKTDSDGIHWVKVEYVNPIMNKSEKAMDVLNAKVNKLKEICKAVAYVGVDFGHGEYELEDSIIKKARDYFNLTTTNKG